MRTAQHPTAVPRGSPSGAPAPRLAWLDRLKALLVAVVIAGHAALGYSGVDGAWLYQDVKETSLSDAGDAVLSLLLVPALFAMGLFFLLSGLVAPASLARKGARRFARDRLLRLGVPLAAWVLGLWPALDAAMRRVAGEPGSWWSELRHADPPLDAGPLWFVAVLLLFSLALAVRPPGAPPRSAPSLRVRTVVSLAAGVSVSTMAIRPLAPIASGQPLQLHLWQWPQYVALFALGVAAAPRGWLDPVPPAVRRVAGRLAAAGALAFVALLAAMAAAGLELDDTGDLRLHWAPLALAALEGPLAVGASLWLVAVAQERLGAPLGRRGRAIARSSYAAFVLQAPVLVALALALRPVAAPAEVKAVVVAAAGVAGSFGLAGLLVSRTSLGRLL